MNPAQINREELREALNNVRNDFIQIASKRGSYVEFAREANFFAKRVLSSRDDGIFSLVRVSISGLLTCFLNIARIGLTIEPAKGFLFVKADYCDRTGQTTCTLEHGYKGLLELIKRSQKVKAITADVVYDNDHFEYNGSREKVTHRVTTLSRAKRGGCDGGYCTSELVNGTVITTTMAAEELEELRLQGESHVNSVWNSAYVDEMYRKSLIKRHYKTLQTSIDDEFVDLFTDDQAQHQQITSEAQG
jgi:phage RecT family recombinase